MEVKKTGISRDLIIHPGETIADLLEERGITQSELAARTDVSPAYVSNVIAGKKDISVNFAFALEYAFGVHKSFWLNLQANYDAELLNANEAQTITEEEKTARESLKDVVKYLRKTGKIPVGEKKAASIISLRKVLQISNIANLKNIVPVGAFRMAAKPAVDPYVLGAWIRLCQLAGENRGIDTSFNEKKIDELTDEIKEIMCSRDANIQRELQEIMAEYGIIFSIVRNFRGAPVQGYISRKNDGAYQMVLTIRGSYADIFWFSLFHELGHIFNGDIGKTARFIDDGCNRAQEAAADLFAQNKLISQAAYMEFLSSGDFSIGSITAFARTQKVMPYIVIGRLQKEKRLDYRCFSEYKLRYKWSE